MMSEDITFKELSEKYIKMVLSGESKEETFSRVTSIANSLDSPLHRLRFLINFLFSPTPEDFRWIQIPEPLCFLYRIIRPIRLLTLALRSKKQEDRSQKKGI